MMWSTEVAHECGHVVIGLLMGGELLNTSADLEYGAGNTRFHFPQGLKTSADLDRLTFLDGLYDLAGIGGEWALSGEVIDLRRSTDDTERFRTTYEAHRDRPVFLWAKDRDMAEVVMTALAEQAVRDHLELAMYIGSQLKSFNAIMDADIKSYGLLPRPLAPGTDWASWFASTAERASEWLRDDNRMHLEREIFNARHRALQAQVEALREFDRRANAPR